MSGNTSSSKAARTSQSGGLEIDSRWALSTIALIGMSFVLSSIPDLDNTLKGRGWQALFNAMHAPLFGALALCGYKTFSRGRQSLTALTLSLAVAGIYAGLDEWHQSFVAGRDASLLDLFIDVGSILVVLLVVYRRVILRSHSAPAQPIPDRRQPETP